MTKQQGQVRLPEPLTRMAENNARALHRPSPEHRVTALLRALSAALSSRNRWLTGLVVVVAAAPSVFLQIPYASGASDPIVAGYRDFSYGTAVNSTPTGEKPESKLWWNDGFWWGCLYSTQAQAYHIYRLDLESQSWVDTQTAIDDREPSKADVLWDDLRQKLYVVSHVFANTGQTESSPSQWGRLYRYTYSTGTQTYTLDSGFPVNVTRGKSETLALAKDSYDRLWVTYVENQKVMINRSLSSDLDWGTPFVLPVSSLATSVSKDDIASVGAFPGNQIGVMWSNQVTKKIHFSVHQDGDADSVWQAVEAPLPDANCTDSCADDHLNLKALQADSGGRVFAVVKTDLSGDQMPAIMLLVRDPVGTWTSYIVARATDNLTRPIVLLDEENGRIHVFATAPEGGGAIYKKTSDINAINFPTGRGDPFIKSTTDTAINNVTSTKQSLNRTTGLLVVASDKNSRFYFHNYISLAEPGAPVIASFTPTSGPVGTSIAITGSNFTGTSTVAFNGTVATSFSVVSDTQIDTVVPAGATTGKITVSNPAGTGTSSGNFTVTNPPMITSFAPTSGPQGTVVTITGSDFTGATSVAFDGVSAAVFFVVSDAQIDATVPSGATTGKISVTTPAGTGYSLMDFTVTGSGGPSPPTVTSFDPVVGPVGTAVTVTGSSFTGTTNVTFNGTPVTSFTVVSDTQITTAVPTGATTGKIGVTNSAGTGLSTWDFTVTFPARIKDITFESGRLVSASDGVDRISGTVNLETALPLKGSYSARIPNIASAYLEESFTLTDDLYVSFYLRANVLPASDVRIALLSNSGTSVGNLYLRANGSLRLRNASTIIGSDTSPLIPGSLYRVGIHQKKGTGNNAVLEAFLALGDNAFGAPFAATATGSWTTAADRFRFGATIAVAVDIVVDDIRLDSGAMPQPSSTNNPAVGSASPLIPAWGQASTEMTILMSRCVGPGSAEFSAMPVPKRDTVVPARVFAGRDLGSEGLPPRLGRDVAIDYFGTQSPVASINSDSAKRNLDSPNNGRPPIDGNFGRAKEVT